MVASQWAGIEIGWLVFAVAIVFLGSAVQSSIGVGLALIAAPTLSMVDPAFIPGSIVMVNLPLTLGIATRERGHIHWDIMRAIPTRLLGTIAGAVIVVTGGQRATSIVVACAVLLAVIASGTRLRVSPTPRNQLIAGAASGLSGTVAGIGGPPMAITYQNEDPRTLRASLAAFNAVSITLLTVPSLMVADVIGWREFRIALVLIPGVFAGLWVGKHAISRLPPERIRQFVLLVCAASAVVLLVRELS